MSTWYLYDCHAKAQTEADIPAHGLLNEEPEMNDQIQTAWTEAELTLVKTSWAAGQSATEIAIQLRDRSRSAVIGIVYRNNFKRAPDAGRIVLVKHFERKARRRLLRFVSAVSLGAEPPPITLAGPVWSHPERCSPTANGRAA